MTGVIDVVGIGADGWSSLTDSAREAVLAADTIVGSQRQLELVPTTGAERRAWPSPIDPLVDDLVAGLAPRVCVLASGDPMLHGIGATLARRVAPERLAVHAQPSAFALACARLGWPAAEVELVSAVGRAPEVVVAALAARRRIVVYVTGSSGAAEIARVLSDSGYGPSRFVVLEALGSEHERVTETTADEWGAREALPLHAVAIVCAGTPDVVVSGRSPGLPDEAYENDGQLTKRVARAAALAALRPEPHALLWDIGAGSGSIGIEWMRAEPTARAVAVEARPNRAARVARNAARLGVPQLEVAEGAAPDALAGLGEPNAVFVGGGLTTPGLVERCWAALAPGGRLVANAVTLEGEAVLRAARDVYGGELCRLEIANAEPIGGYTAWRPQLPIVQWSARKGSA